MKTYWLLALTLLILAAPAKAKNADKEFRAVLEKEWQYQLDEYPELATRVGTKGHDDRWTDMSPTAIARRNAHEIIFLRQLNDFRGKRLSAREQLFLEITRDSAQRSVERQKYNAELLAIDQLGGPQNSITRLLSIQEKASLSDYSSLLSRLHGIPGVIDQTIDLLTTGMKQGITPPKVTLRDVDKQIEALISGEPLKSPLLEAFQKFPDNIPIKRQQELASEASNIFKTEVKPAFEKLRSFLRDSYYPKARDSIGLSEMPQGREWYSYLIKMHTTTNLTADEVHDIGLKEVQRIKLEMEGIIKQVNFKGSFADFLIFLRTDKQFYFDDAESVIVKSRDIAKQIDPQLPKLIGKLPRLTYGVSPVPSYSEKSQPLAYYMPGSVKAGRAGYFFMNTFDLKSQPKWGMEAVILHESVPGHHLQLSLAQEMEDVPELIKFNRVTAFIEGWGLYAESLGADLGLYKDPYSKFGQLTYEMWRAVRLVVDTGMHSKGWSRDRAIEFFQQNTGKSDHDIEAEVDRYTVWPGQALSYKIGELKIKELRARAEAKLGDRFDLKVFHDNILANGSVPLSVLETQINHWIDKSAKEPM